MLAPNLYPQRIALLHTAATKSIDVIRVQEFLWLLNACPDLAELETVVGNLSKVLSDAEACWPGILSTHQIDWMPDLLSKIKPIANPVQTPSQGGQSFSQAANSGQTISNTDWVTRNALYSALEYSRPDKSLGEEYRLLQAHYFFAHLSVVRKTAQQDYENYGEREEWPALTIMPYHCGLAVRNLRKDEPRANLVLTRLPLRSAPREFAEVCQIDLDSMFSNEDKSWEQYRVDYIANFIRQSYGMKARAEGWGSDGDFKELSGIGDHDDPNFDLGEMSDWEFSEIAGEDEHPPQNPDKSSKSGSRTGGSRSERLSWDDCPDEDNDFSGFNWGADSEDFERSPGSFGAAQLAIANQVIRQNKMFAFGNEHLAPHELIRFGNRAYERLF